MTEITFEELQQYFEDYVERVSGGESFLITGGHSDFVMLPAHEYDEFVRISNKD